MIKTNVHWRELKEPSCAQFCAGCEKGDKEVT